MDTNGTRKRRPHPARRARKFAGALSVASLLALTGCMAATAKTATGAAPGTTATTASPTTTSTAAISGTSGRRLELQPLDDGRRGRGPGVGPVEHVDPCQLNAGSAPWAATPT